jgi:hypothetical protein
VIACAVRSGAVAGKQIADMAATGKRIRDHG